MSVEICTARNIYSFYDKIVADQPNVTQVVDAALLDRLQWASSRASIFITRGLKKLPTTSWLCFDFITPRDWAENPDTALAKYLENDPDVPCGRLEPIPAIQFTFDRIWGDSIPEFHIMWANLLNILLQRNPELETLCDTLSVDWNYLSIASHEDDIQGNKPVLMTFKPPATCRRLILHNLQCRQFGFNLQDLAIPEIFMHIATYHPNNSYVINPATELIMMFHKDKSVARDLADKISSLNPQYTVYIGEAWKLHCIITVKNNIDILAILENYAALNPK